MSPQWIKGVMRLWAIPKLNNSHVNIQSWLHSQLFLLSWEVFMLIIVAKKCFSCCLTKLVCCYSHMRSFWSAWRDIAGLNWSRSVLFIFHPSFTYTDLKTTFFLGFVFAHSCRVFLQVCFRVTSIKWQALMWPLFTLSRSCSFLNSFQTKRTNLRLIFLFCLGI